MDRSGNESRLGTLVQAATPPRPYPPQQFELRFDRAKLQGHFSRAKAQGTRGKEYIIIPGKTAPKPAAEVAWPIDLKHGGTYYFWLRYLPKGAVGRSAAVKQEIKVCLDGKPVTSVGGGLTCLSIPKDDDVRPWFWTWARPVTADLNGVKLPAGRHTLTLQNLNRAIRYDVLFITDEPSFLPKDGRLRQH